MVEQASTQQEANIDVTIRGQHIQVKMSNHGNSWVGLTNLYPGISQDTDVGFPRGQSSIHYFQLFMTQGNSNKDPCTTSNGT